MAAAMLLISRWAGVLANHRGSPPIIRIRRRLQLERPDRFLSIPVSIPWRNRWALDSLRSPRELFLTILTSLRKRRLPRFEAAKPSRVTHIQVATILW